MFTKKIPLIPIFRVSAAAKGTLAVLAECQHSGGI